MDQPHFSLILPILNGMPGLRRAMEAVRRQSYRNFELVVQDGGSRDGSLEYLRQLDLPSVSIVSEPDHGIGQAYNRAMQRARGRLVVPLACDEWLDDKALETFARWDAEHPNAAFVFGGSQFWKTEHDVYAALQPDQFDLFKFMMSEMAPTAGGYFNKAIIGPDFYLNENLKTCPDFDLFIRLGLRFDASKIVVKQEILHNAMVDRSSRSYRPEFFAQMTRDRAAILQQNFAQHGASPFLHRLRDACISSMYCHLAVDLMNLAGETSEVHGYLFEAARHQPGSAKLAGVVARLQELRDTAFGQRLGRKVISVSEPPNFALPIDGILDVNSANSSREWIATGARTRVQDDRVLVTTSWAAWTPAAQIPFQFGELLADATDETGFRLELSVKVISGRVAVGILNKNGRINDERLLSEGDEAYVALPFGPGDAALFVRNAADGISATALADFRVLGLQFPGSETRSEDIDSPAAEAATNCAIPGLGSDIGAALPLLASGLETR